MIVNSPFGEGLKAVRDNEQRATSQGYRADRYKLMAFVTSGALAGLAGSLKAIISQSAHLSDMQWGMSGEAQLMTLTGGLGSMYGPIVGAFIVFAMRYYCASFRERVAVMQCPVFVTYVMLFRRGIAGETMNWWQIPKTAQKKGQSSRGLQGDPQQLNGREAVGNTDCRFVRRETSCAKH